MNKTVVRYNVVAGKKVASKLYPAVHMEVEVPNNMLLSII